MRLIHTKTGRWYKVGTKFTYVSGAGCKHKAEILKIAEFATTMVIVIQLAAHGDVPAESMSADPEDIGCHVEGVKTTSIVGKNKHAIIYDDAGPVIEGVKPQPAFGGWMPASTIVDFPDYNSTTMHTKRILLAMADARFEGPQFGRYVTSIGQFYVDGSPSSDWKVTHWMPLPPMP